MRDAIAGVIAGILALAAISLAATLRSYRRRRQRAHEAQLALGRRVIAEIPSGDDLVLFTEDDRHFYYGGRSIDKRFISAVRLLINRSAIATHVSRLRYRPSSSERPEGGAAASAQSTPGPTDQAGDVAVEGLVRDRWDVAVDVIREDAPDTHTILIECGAIRERVSQELARTVFDAVIRSLEQQEATAPRSHTEGI